MGGAERGECLKKINTMRITRLPGTRKKERIL